MRKPNRFKGIGRASGAAIGALAVKVFECNGCHAQHRGSKPAQCLACGRLDFAKIDSLAEATRLGELRLLQHAGLISDLEKQVRFPLLAHHPDGKPRVVGHYIADFVYQRDGAQVIEDAKGSAVTDIAAWKLRHMEAQGSPVVAITSKGKR